MVFYLDSSSIVKLYLDEVHSVETRELLRGAENKATALISYAEVRSALAAALRNARIDSVELVSKRAEFDEEWTQFLQIQVESDMVLAAGDLAERHSLSGFDSIHLASAISLRHEGRDEVYVSTWDGRLASAALREGFVLAHEVTS